MGEGWGKGSERLLMQNIGFHPLSTYIAKETCNIKMFAREDQNQNLKLMIKFLKGFNNMNRITESDMWCVRTYYLSQNYKNASVWLTRR